MKRKIISLISIIFILIFTLGAIPNYSYGADYSNNFINISIPNSFQKEDETVEKDGIDATYMRETNNDMCHYSAIRVADESTTAQPVFTQEDLEALVENQRQAFAQEGLDIKVYYQQLIELNGYKGIRLTFEVFQGIESVYYVDEYYFLTDHYLCTLGFACDRTTSSFIGSTEQKNIINSFKIKDTVLKSRQIPFTDVASNSWSFSAIKYCYDNGIIKGLNDYTFSPNTNLTRGMLVTILNRMEGSLKAKGTSKFADVQDSSKYYYNSVVWATENKIVSGYDNGKFGPEDPITREQLAIMLNKYCRYKGKYKETNGDLSKFKDADKIAPYAISQMKWAVGTGVITGNATTSTLNPKGNATRAEVASMLYKYCTRVK